MYELAVLHSTAVRNEIHANGRILRDTRLMESLVTRHFKETCARLQTLVSNLQARVLTPAQI